MAPFFPELEQNYKDGKGANEKDFIFTVCFDYNDSGSPGLKLLCERLNWQ